MDVISDYLLNNHDNLLFAIAAISLLIELALIGLSGPLLFFAIGCGLTGLLVSFQVIHGWEIEVLFVGILSLLSAIILWAPLKKFQGTTKVHDRSSDLIGQRVMVSETITISSGSVRYSGINWSARLDTATQIEVITSGTQVLITGVDGNIILVKSIAL